eukprot:GHVT01030016.1.p1 GENE.GHVT01030016.1~~GHVT01030016.1.p1  ORF type:complete len:199 (+),score=47.80 GHVT01030016.1:477-1073(+)
MHLSGAAPGSACGVGAVGDSVPIAAALKRLEIESFPPPSHTPDRKQAGPLTQRFTLQLAPPPRSAGDDQAAPSGRVEVIIMNFVNSLFIVVTDTGKIGTFVEARAESAEDGIFSCRVLLGDRKRLHYQVYARELMGRISQAGDQSLLLGIKLEDERPETFRAVCDAIKKRLPPVDESIFLAGQPAGDLPSDADEFHEE